MMQYEQMETNFEIDDNIINISCVSNTKKNKKLENTKVTSMLKTNVNETNLDIIKRFIKYCHDIYSNLNNINYNDTTINYYSINSFNVSSRSNNDKNNKIRETIIGAIINDQIPTNYYKYSLLWKRLKYEIDKYILDYKLKNMYWLGKHKFGNGYNRYK